MAAIQVGGALRGKLSSGGSLKGVVSIPQKYESYSGEYEVTPSATSDQTLHTAGKLLENDITIGAIPYYETGNASEGITVYIAKED